MDDDNARDDVLDARFRRALDSILDLVVIERAIRDASGEIVDFEILWMNNAPVDVAGRPREELIGRRISELYPVLAGGELIAGYRQVVETGEPLVVDVLPYEDVIDGNHVTGFFTVQASKFEDGVLVASRDITPLESSRRELEIALGELEGAQRLAQLGTWRVNFLTGEAVVSRELQWMYGTPTREPDGYAASALMHHVNPADRHIVNAAYERAGQVRGPVVFEHRVLTVGGSTRHVRTYAEAVFEGDAVVGMWGTTQDVTDRIANRDALDAEHSARVTAEALAELATTLNGATTRQEIADAAFRMMQTFGRVSVVALGLNEPDAPVVREHFGGPGVAPEITARYLRTPFSVDTPLTRAVTTDATVMLRDRATLAAEFPALVADFDKVGFSNLIVLPLHRATSVVFGGLAVGWEDACPLDDMLPTLEEVATICARTAERLELLDLERSIAQTLQLGLLALDSRSTQTIVRARYQPADNTIAIGGDWYDAVDIGDGRTAVAVGDVVGRGLPAATTMGQLRAALGITALQANDAADAVRILDRYARHVPGAECATVAFAVVDPRRQTVSYACAGHLPPLLARPDGTVEFLDAGTSWPLGLDIPKPRPPAAVTSLPPASLLLLYTDGLVERRGESLDVGLARLRAVVEQHSRLPLRRLKNAIFSHLVDGLADDDIALVALRAVGSTPEVFADVLAARHQELAGARHRLRAWLEQHDISEQERDAILVAVSEAVANGVDHGSDDEDQIVRVEATIHDGRLIVSVSDSGHWQPGVEGYFHGRGRGHLLMQSFAEAVDIDTDQHGTIVTLIFERERQLA